jgi:dipeptidyl aminopeptidase/acylaminoacyl peptidase
MTEKNPGKPVGAMTIDALVDIASPSEPHLAPDGFRVVYVQNVGDTRQMFALPCEGGWPLRLTSGERSVESPRWSPDGERLVYVRGKAVVVADGDGANARTLTEHEAGNSMPRWSPDGSQIAFYSRRRGWSQIWAIDAAGGEPRRLTEAAEDNDDLQWSPDGTRIAFSSIRGSDLNNRDIYCVDAGTGVETRLTNVPGCFDGAPAWSPDGSQIAFLSDRDGWVHVYRMPADGTERQQLTFGACEDGWPTLGRGYLHWSPDGEQIAFARNHEGRLDAMVLDVRSGALDRLSNEEGFAQPAGWTPDGRWLLCLFSRPDLPSDLWLLASGGRSRRLTQSLAGGLRREHFAVPERIVYRSQDGLPIHAQLYRPQLASAESRCPAIVHAHGGPTYQAYFSWPDPITQLFVQEGYAVLEPDFRGSSGYGREFRLANNGEWGVSDAGDCVQAAEYLRGLDWVDRERIGIWGGSYGGYLVLCCLTASPRSFRAGIDMFGDSEIAESYRHGDRLGRLDLHRQMGSPDEHAEDYRRGSPVYRAEQVEAPLLILHGRDDSRVVPLMSERMAEALKIEGKFFEHHFYEGEGHGFRRAATRRDAYQRMLAFFDRYLKGDG